MMAMFTKILVANRGEIACRVMATARRMGIGTVAVFSEADAGARHVAMADEAYGIGAAPARDSYLRGAAILGAALRAGAQAIHPGYGFLSENADFADECAAAGVVFIGPPASAIRAMGSKAAAKTLMERSGVPLVPGYHGDDQSDAVIAAEAARIGYPVLLKASAGGGGKGMRVVEGAGGLAEAVERARGEARASFGDDRLLIEKYLTHPRHIEVQVFGDTHGNIVSLFERDCSIQRRHQKVLEESPAPFITPEQRRALGDAAIAAARAVNYVGAGTVEFIYEDERFYFMEMNTRLQVEHPVTEFVTGLDLVEWQLRVAAGERLPVLAEGLRMRGHAIEARICAEDPAADFMPATGLVRFLREPAAEAHVRVDTGLRAGDAVTPYYDSMIAKLIVWDEDRPAALRRLATALSAYELVGPRTNLDLLRRIAVHSEFGLGGVDTGFIGAHPELIEARSGDNRMEWAAAALSLLRPHPIRQAGDPWSPWGETDGWSVNAPAEAIVELRCGDDPPCAVAAFKVPTGWRLDLPGASVVASLDMLDDEGAGILAIDGARVRLRVLRHGEAITIVRDGHNLHFTAVDRLAAPALENAADSRLIAATPARVVSVFVEPGAHVAKGQRLLILEAMKVEMSFTAPRDGTVEAVHVTAGELVQEGTTLVTFVAVEGG